MPLKRKRGGTGSRCCDGDRIAGLDLGTGNWLRAGPVCAEWRGVSSA